MTYAANALPRLVAARPAVVEEKPNTVWGDAVIDDLRSLAASGQYSAANIASILNDKHNLQPPISRCAVIGKCSRASIPLKSKTGGAAPKEPRKARSPRMSIARIPRISSAERMLVLPTDRPAARLSISPTHRLSLILAARSFESFHQAIIDRETQLEDAACAGEAVEIAFPIQPDDTLAWWPVSEGEAPLSPKTLFDLGDRECNFITAKSSSNDSYFCGHKTAAGEKMCRGHRQLCYIPPKSK